MWQLLIPRLQELYRLRREQTKQVLAWVALRSGKQYLEWEEGGSTRTCHDCGFVVVEGIAPSIREWDCPGPDCTSHHIRDENAARNGLTRTLKALGLPCSGRRGVSSRRAWRFNGLGLAIRGSLTGSATGASRQEIKSEP
jgi:putative transposase